MIAPSTLFIAQQIEANFKVCGFQKSSNFTLVLKNSSLVNFRLSTTEKYDYIEYYFGIDREGGKLFELRQLLSERGILGLTYFTKNHHQEALFDLIHSVRNESVHLPFSRQREFLIKKYLETQGMEFLVKDEYFMNFFGATSSDYLHKYRYSMSHSLVNESFGAPYSQEEIEDLVHTNGFHIQQWLPSAFCHPFGRHLCPS